MSDWQQRKFKSKREIESGKFLRELLNSPTVQSKRAFVAQYNPLHYILITTQESEHGLPQ